MKSCRMCGIEQPLSEFYKHPMMADGHLNQCKTCKKSYQNQHRAENIVQIREYDVGRAKRPERQAHMEQVTKRMRKDHPEKQAAHNAVARAVRKGTLIKPSSCERCPRADHLHAHHDDYTKPLDVMWLCPVCHKVRHKELDGLQAA